MSVGRTTVLGALASLGLVIGVAAPSTAAPTLGAPPAVDRATGQSVVEQPPPKPDVRVVRGQPARYPHDVPAGGVRERGKFVFTNGGDDRVVRYFWMIDGQPQGMVDVIPGAPDGRSERVAFVPEATGIFDVTVVAYRDGGAVGPARLHRAIVQFPVERGRWGLEEGTGRVAHDETVFGRHLRLTASTTWVEGLGSLHAIELDEPWDGASARQVLNLRRAFTATVYARLDSGAASAIALSQDGQEVSGFELGYQRDDACPETSDPTVRGCFVFAMPVTDSAGLEVVTVAAPDQVVLGQWYMLAGSYNPSRRNAMALHVCDDPTFVRTYRGAVEPSWAATGRFQVGRAREAGSPVRTWAGQLDRPLVFRGELTDEKLRDVCGG